MSGAMALRLLAFMALLLLSTGCMARQRMWHGDVRQSPDGHACFSIKDEAWIGSDVVRVAGIIVSEIDYAERAQQATWTADFTRGEPATMLSAKTCIPYGLDDGSNRAVGPIIPIKPGGHYSVFINADIRNGSGWSNRGYGAYFCAAQGADGLVIYEVIWDEEQGRRDWAVCGADSPRDGRRRHRD